MTNHNSPVGIEILDSLKGLQLIADRLDDPTVKSRRLKQGLQELSAGGLLEHQYLVSSAQVIGREPGAAPSEVVLFDLGLFFIATLDAFGYIRDYTIPIDCLSLNIVEPEVIGADERDAPLFRLMTLQVPVLAIDSCCSAEAV